MASSSARARIKSAARAGLRWLYFTHRWLGVAACLFFAMWFFSGLVMMYVPYPSLTKEERLAQSPAIAWDKVRLSPEGAMETASAQRFPAELRLEMMGAEPVYRIDLGDRRADVSAVDGRIIDGVGPEAARDIAAAFAPGTHPTLIRRLERDQWTVAGGFDSSRPLYLFDLHDGRGGRLYVSRRTGEVVQDTTGRERFWNWLGSVPHWLYPTVVRQNQPAWRQVVMWTSGVGVISAITGAWIGLLRLRLRPRPGQPASPYRGWMKWHHWAGLIGGLFLTTWIVSGWWSVNPFRWFDTPSVSEQGMTAYAGRSEPRLPTNLAALANPARGAKQARFYWLGGQPFAALESAGKTWVLNPATGAPSPLTDAALFAAAKALAPGAPVASTVRQTVDDDYWYSHHERRPLPVLRVAYADPDRTWMYIEPATGQVLGVNNASSRAYRWVFAGLHQMDFRVLIHHRPAWDVALWLLAAGGVVTSVSGVVIGWRRLKPKPRRGRTRAAA